MTLEQLKDFLDDLAILDTGEIIEKKKYGWTVLTTKRGCSGTFLLKLGKNMDCCGIDLAVHPVTKTECIRLIFN